jgi:hypothetical protein
MNFFKPCTTGNGIVHRVDEAHLHVLGPERGRLDRELDLAEPFLTGIP